MTQRLVANRFLLSAFLALVLPTCALARSRSFTLEQVMSAPFPTDLTVAPAGAKTAWVFNASGVRNVWVAEASPDGGKYIARQLTSYGNDDGQDIGELAWLPDASGIVYGRGGDFENGGAYPNPESLPRGVE
ncbi:MAG: S9 family peptidase, partial [Acidobacteriota bacterium]